MYDEALPKALERVTDADYQPYGYWFTIALGCEDRKYAMVKVSKSINVKDWLAALDPEKRAAAKAIRRAVRAAAPAITEKIKWGRPVFALEANIAYLAAAKNHITFGYFDGARLDDPEGLLEGSGKQMRSIKVRAEADVPVRAIKIGRSRRSHVRKRPNASWTRCARHCGGRRAPAVTGTVS